MTYVGFRLLKANYMMSYFFKIPLLLLLLNNKNQLRYANYY
jgi:hypothetical protein